MNGGTGQRAAIVGAGMSGLAAATMLAHRGWRVEIHERWPRIKAVGTGIGVWPNAMEVLDRVGIGERLREVAVAQPGGSLRSPDGRVLATLRDDMMQKRFGGAVSLVSRARILSALTDAMHESGARLHLDSSPDIAELAERNDVVVGADGIASAVRAHMFGGADPRRSSGFWTIRGTDRRTLTPYGETWGDGQIFGVTPIEDGATNWYAAMRTPDHRRPTVDDLREWYAGWHDPIGELLEDADPADVLCHEVQHVWPVPRSYVSGHVVLIGDAAHAMPPNLGQGGAQSLLDAACLTDELARRPVTAALAAYDKQRRRPTRRYVAGSIAVGRVALARGRAARTRDRVTRALPGTDPLARR